MMSIVSPDFQNLTEHVENVNRPRNRQTAQSRHSVESISKATTTETGEELVRNHQYVLNQYLQDTKLLPVLNSWIVLISGLEELPYNPYPTLVWYARRHAERFNMFKEDEDTIFGKIDGIVYKAGIHATRTFDDPPWWGLHIILKAVSAKALKTFHLLISKCTFSYPELKEDQYTVHKPVAVLVGPCVFVGSLYPEVPLIQVRLEHAISGPFLDAALKIFSSLVLHAIKMIEDDKTFVLLDVFVPQYSDLNDIWIDTRWTCKAIMENMEKFVSSVREAAKNQKFIIAECLFVLTCSRDNCRRGEIQFNLNFIRVQSDRTMTDAAIPYRSAFEGIFSTHSSFISYLGWFQNIERSKNTPEFNEPTEDKTKKSKGFLDKARSVANSASESMSFPLHIDNNDFASTSSDTTVYPDEGAYTKDVQDTIRKFLLFMISSLPGESNLFPMLHYIMLLLLLDKDEGQKGLVEAARLLQSTLYCVHCFMEKSTILQGLIAWFSNNESNESYLVQTFFLQLRLHLKDLFCNKLNECSSDLAVAGRVLLERLDVTTVTSHSYASQSNELVTLPLKFHVIEELKSVNRYCTTLMFGLTDDTLNFCPTLRGHFPPIKTGGNILKMPYNFQHGVESLSILAQGNMYMNRVHAKKTISAPSFISNQATILKYFVETKVDQVFHEFLGHMLNGSFLLPNPYQSLVTHLRTAAVRMELFHEKQEKLLSRLLPGSSQIVDTQNHIYSCPGSEAYGVKSAVSCLDVKCYNVLLQKLSVIQNSVKTRVTDAGIKVTIGFALTGFTPLYGRLMPYIHQIELEEHYFLQGPINAKMDIINLFTRLVYDHLVGIAEESSILFVGLFLGDVSVRQSLLDIVPSEKKLSFLTQLSTYVKNEKPVYMKAYVLMDWRLVLVKKSFLLHYIQGQFQGYQRFFKQHPLSYYQNIFSSQFSASMFARACGPQDRSDPLKGESLRTSLVHVDHCIESARHDGDFLNAFRWMLVRSLMSQSTIYVAQAWYMSQSAAAQLEYLMILNSTLQNLVYEELSRTFAPHKQDRQDTESLLDVTVLGEMMQAYCQKLDKVLQRATSMAPSGLLNLLHEKLRSITERRKMSNTLQLKIDKQTPIVLQSINELLQPLLDSSAQDILQALFPNYI